MKRTFAILVLSLILTLALTGCACEHQWAEADCVNPKTCSLCQETEGAPLGHSWLAATCTAPQTCQLCGQTQGEALAHNYLDATCAAPQTCKDCGATQGEALPHTYQDATCTAPKTCSECNATEGEALGHQWVDATYSAPKTCSLCQTTEGEALVRTDLGMNLGEIAQRIDTSLQLLGYRLDYIGDDSDGWPVYDLLEASTNSYANVYISFEPAADGINAYAFYACTEDLSDVNAIALVGAVSTVALLCVDENFDTAMLQDTLNGQPEIYGDMACYYMEDCGLAADMQVYSDFMIFWVYPAE